MRAAVLLVLAGCWTGSSSPAPNTPSNSVAAATERRPMRFRVTLERTPCLGMCPSYRVTIHGNGKVDWEGIDNVVAMGRLDGSREVSYDELLQLSLLIDEAKFFDRNQYGEIETGPICTKSGNTTTCSSSIHICTDTTHSKITVSRAGRTHVVDNDHCDEKPGIDELEVMIDQLAGTAELVGR
jgi:hypothetical protein